jgi:hypothetical protein
MRAGREHVRHTGVLRLLRTREDAVALGLLVQLAAFVVFPALHLFDHAGAHEHGPDGISHVATHHPGPSEEEGTPRPDHGQGSFEHFAAALVSSPLFVFLPAVLPVTSIVPVALSGIAANGPGHGCAQPRGPPVA